MSDEIVQEALKWMLEVIFPQSRNLPSSYYMGLCEDATILETDTLSDLTELSGLNYSRQAVPAGSVTGFTSSTAGTADWKVTTITVQFEASGGAWNGATHCFLATTTDDSGVLVAASALSTTRTLQDGDKLDVSMVIQLNG